jgi:hypothetical protein
MTIAALDPGDTRQATIGPLMAGRAEQLVGDPAVVAAATAALAGDLLTSVSVGSRITRSG